MDVQVNLEWSVQLACAAETSCRQSGRGPSEGLDFTARARRHCGTDAIVPASACPNIRSIWLQGLKASIVAAIRKYRFELDALPPVVSVTGLAVLPLAYSTNQGIHQLLQDSTE